MHQGVLNGGFVGRAVEHADVDAMQLRRDLGAAIGIVELADARALVVLDIAVHLGVSFRGW